MARKIYVPFERTLNIQWRKNMAQDKSLVYIYTAIEASCGRTKSLLPPLSWQSFQMRKAIAIFILVSFQLLANLEIYTY
jgi:hypothetical protein